MHTAPGERNTRWDKMRQDGVGREEKQRRGTEEEERHKTRGRGAERK